MGANYAWLNPHLTLNLEVFGNAITYEATDPGWKKWGPSQPTSPHWYEVEHLERLIAAYVTHDQDAGRERTVRELVAEFRGLASTVKQKRILDATGLFRAPLSSLCTDTAVDRAKVEPLLEAMREQSRPVKPAALGVIGKEHLAARMETFGVDMETFQYKRAFHVEETLPQVIEVAFGYCEDLEERHLVTGVNWAPGIHNPFRSLGRFGISLDSFLGNHFCDTGDPVVVVVHLATPRAEFTDRGKSAVVVS